MLSLPLMNSSFLLLLVLGAVATTNTIVFADENVTMTTINDAVSNVTNTVTDVVSNVTDALPNLTEAVSNATEKLDCVAGTAVLKSDESVKTALAAAIAGTLELKDPLTCVSSGSAVSCQYNFNDAKSNFAATCETVGGKVVDKSFTVSCKNDGKSGGVNYIFEDAPACVDPSCDESKYYDSLEETAVEVAERMNNIEGLKDCESTVSSSATTTYYGNFLFVVLAATVSAILVL